MPPRVGIIGLHQAEYQEVKAYLLEVNHIPNVTQFPELWEGFRDHVVDWLGQL